MLNTHLLSVLFTDSNFPRFAEPIPNITVTVGRDALLACVVDNLKAYKVSILFGIVFFVFVFLFFFSLVFFFDYLLFLPAMLCTCISLIIFHFERTKKKSNKNVHIIIYRR